ncbi:MAG: ferredoxin [Gammaproteobacteria bacterium]|nr:ferredoxin [Gammaproteobacteria bacterium]
MADKANKVENNVDGAYYVDKECIGCGMCHEVAGKYFVMDDTAGVAYVAEQPKDEEGTVLCVEAMNSCPVEAIGDDGAAA